VIRIVQMSALVLASLLVMACGTHEPAITPPVEQVEQPEPVVEPAEPPTRDFGYLATRSARAAPIIEVVLDARASAALTLESDGHVRLQDSLAASAPLPWQLPSQDPIWMTFARQRDAEAFTIALIDTTNGAQVLELRPSDRELARVEQRFAIPPSDPLLEIHVLDGGDRILALGIDHRLRLYDLAGQLLAELDARGFAPWQLRLTGGDGREPLHLAVTLAGPLRIQRVALDGDQLSPLGDAHELELDRGPNRNDLVLSSDGRFAAALRRHKANRPEWSVELVELETGARKLIAGSLDTSVRPRLHLLDGNTMLLESGSGRGYLVDLAQATPLRRQDDADPDSRFALGLARSTEHRWIELGTAELDEQQPELDAGLRMHASVVGRTRAGINEKGELTLYELPD
jgi:hypothetical protein